MRDCYEWIWEEEKPCREPATIDIELRIGSNLANNAIAFSYHDFAVCTKHLPRIIQEIKRKSEQVSKSVEETTIIT